MQASPYLKTPVKIWLVIGLVMIFFQIIIGGITRLTGSGLSITKWDIVTGAIPPLNHDQWQDEFELYKRTPQYQKINQGMDLSRIKWIYFWEYLHRLWARSMGFVFLIPLVIFWLKGYLGVKGLKKDLLIVFLLAALVGMFGWIMVGSGLVERPWVNAYKLSIHLGLALITLSFLWWVFLKYQYVDRVSPDKIGTVLARTFLFLVSIQILLGGMMSGMKAALLFPSFPMMGSHLIDPIIFKADSWQWMHFVDYDVYPFLPALVQVLHRSLAMAVLTLFFIAVFRLGSKSLMMIGIILIVQIILGIWTLLSSIGTIPVGLGVMHQAVGIMLLMAAVHWYFMQHRAGR